VGLHLVHLIELAKPFRHAVGGDFAADAFGLDDTEQTVGGPLCDRFVAMLLPKPERLFCRSKPGRHFPLRLLHLKAKEAQLGAVERLG
jgi:hypothetical protein